MENNRGQSIFLSVVGVATLLVAIVGATFAYFSITVTGNNTASSIKVDTAVLGNVVFADGTNIDVDNIYPGWYRTKNFTVSNAQAGATELITYKINFNVTTNTISSATGGSAFVYSLSGSSNHSGTVVSASNATPPATGVTSQIGSNGVLNGTDTHTYTFTIVLNETSTDQNSLQGKSFSGVLQVVLLDSGGRYTWDNATSSRKVYP